MAIDTLIKVIGLVFTAAGSFGGLGFIFKKLYERDKAKRLGLQAVLRNQMLDQWRYYSDAGFSPLEIKQNFESTYQCYHNLGANGVMDEVREKFLNLPDHL